MKNETLILIVAFVGILYLIYHHNNTISNVTGNTNLSPASTGINLGISGGRGGGSTYTPPTPISLITGTRTPTSGTPTCTGGSCGGVPTLTAPPRISGPDIAPTSSMTRPIQITTTVNPIVERFPFLANRFQTAKL